MIFLGYLLGCHRSLVLAVAVMAIPLCEGQYLVPYQ